MSIRLDPRRVGYLKQLAGDAGVRPGDLVRQWVEERIDAERSGGATTPPARNVVVELEALAARIEALETAAGIERPGAEPASFAQGATQDHEASAAEELAAGADASVTGPAAIVETEGAEVEATGDGEARNVDLAPDAVSTATVTDGPTEPAPEADEASRAEQPPAPVARRARGNRVAAAPSGERVALHEEMIAVLAERGPMSAAELAAAISERGRYAPPRSGKALDAAMVSQRVSNPTYRARFMRQDGRIGLADPG